MTTTRQSPGFTDQEHRVADGILRGLSYAEIARELQCSPHTVRTHVRTMAKKLVEPSELAPRWRVYFWLKAVEWESERAGWRRA